MKKLVVLGKVFLLTLIAGVCFTGKVFASDNVLQAIQIDGAKDSYNVILKSDDVAEVKKTIQAPNKMILNLKGIRASKAINTIYNNTSNVDSVVVEPTGDDSVKILIQADNANNAEVNFDTLKTPLGVLDKSEKQSSTDELVLNGPMASYKPVYDENANTEENSGFSLAGAMSGTAAKGVKKALKSDKTTLVLGIGMVVMFILSGIKTIKGKDSEIKVGLTQSLREKDTNRDTDLRNSELYNEIRNSELAALNSRNTVPQQLSGNFGLKAYQDGMRSPYTTPEIARPRKMVTPEPVASPQPMARTISSNPIQNNTMQNTIQRPSLKTAPAAAAMAARPKTTNIDSMKFLESMTKIYEKNGRSDLAQGLKQNMKKAKVNLA